MEFKKKTIIGEDNNEPPKNYIWVKSDGKMYEYSYIEKAGVESGAILGNTNNEGSGSEENNSNENTEDNEIGIDYDFLMEVKRLIENSFEHGFSSDDIHRIGEGPEEEGVVTLGDKDTAEYVTWAYDENTGTAYDIYLKNKELILLAQMINPYDTSVNWIDLGLPSGNLWADMNIGAKASTAGGLFFYFGICNPINEYSKTAPNALWPNPGIRYAEMFEAPSKSDFEELISETTQTVETVNDVDGILFTSKVNSNSIFIPLSGYYEPTGATGDEFRSDGARLHTATQDEPYVYYVQLRTQQGEPQVNINLGYTNGGCAVRPCKHTSPIIGAGTVSAADTPGTSRSI